MHLEAPKPTTKTTPGALQGTRIQKNEAKEKPEAKKKKEEKKDQCPLFVFFGALLQGPQKRDLPEELPKALGLGLGSIPGEGSGEGFLEVETPMMNMIAGHLLLVLCFSATQYFFFNSEGIFKTFGAGTFTFGFVFTLFEMLVAFLQAYVFTLLTTVYIQLSLADEH